MTSLIPYHAEPTQRFSSLSPGELSKLCHLDLLCILATIRLRSALLLHALFTRATVALKRDRGCQPCLFPPPFPHPSFPPLLSVPAYTDRRGIQNASAPRSMPRITSRTRTLTAIADLYFRDPYYLNAGALLLAGWYPRDRNIPRHNEPRGQPLSLTNLQHKKKKRISRLEASFDSRERGIQVFQQIATTLVNRDLARDWKVGFG